MFVKSSHKKTRCPSCGSKDIHTDGLDQLCLDCDWSNARMLVDLGQLDRMKLAGFHQFIQPLSFGDLKDDKGVSNQLGRSEVA